MELSSPSSSNFSGLGDLGSESDIASMFEKQFLDEFQSTRIGVRRVVENRGASFVTGPDGNVYAQAELNVKSYAARNQYALAVAEGGLEQTLEWDRRLITRYGVANGRLYQLRLQVPERDHEAQRALLNLVLDSFRAFEVMTV